MLKKICTTCKQELNIKEFSKQPRGKYGVKARCKRCTNAYNRSYREKNQDTLRKKQKLYYDQNKDKCSERWKKYYQKNKVRLLEKKKLYRNSPHGKRIEKIYYKKYLAVALQRRRIRRKIDTSYRISCNLRHRVGMSITKGYKSKQTMDLLGCSINDLKKHLSSLFQDGMSWKNYGRGGWHIDHIRPCSSFDLTDPEQQKQCFHYTNLQPLWEIDNLRKGSKYE